MSSTTLFGKLQEHKIELKKLERHEDEKKNLKSLALNIRFKDHDSNQEDDFTIDEDYDLIKKF